MSSPPSEGQAPADDKAAAEGATLPETSQAGTNQPDSQPSDDPQAAQASTSFPPPPTQPISSASMSSGTAADNSGIGSGASSIPPPAPVPPQQQQPLDSLSLSQLRRLASELPRNEPITYDFTYEDMGDFDEEIDEWFSYQVWQWVRLNYAQQHFENRWEHKITHGKRNGEHDDHNDHDNHDEYNDGGPAEGQEEGDDGNFEKEERLWDTVGAETQEFFVSDLLSYLESGKPRQRAEVIGCLVYLLLGRWGTTAGGPADGKSSPTARTVARPRQLSAMKAAAALIGKLGGIPILWKALRQAFEPFWYVWTLRIVFGFNNGDCILTISGVLVMYSNCQQVFSKMRRTTWRTS